MIVLQEPFQSRWRDKDPFVAVEALSGKVYREMKRRRTLEVALDGRHYFVKIHRGIGWCEIFKNLLTGKLPVLGAETEWKALSRLRDAGVPSMNAVAFGKRGLNPARQQSFIVTEALSPTVDLEIFTQNWLEKPPPPALKRALIREVSRMTRAMHRAGINHRDCYLCHFLLHTDAPTEPPRLSLIDLHRAQIRARTPRRWRDKDLAALYFSALDIGLGSRDCLRFLRDYFDCPARDLLRNKTGFLRRLEQKAVKLRARKERYGDAL